MRAIRAALADAGLAAGDVGMIVAHGNGTPQSDVSEAAAIKTVFGDRAPPITGFKWESMIGHLLGAAGAVEAIATIKSICDNKVHPTINYETPDPECDLNYIPNAGREWTVNVAISNTFGFGGHNASLLFKRFMS